MPGYATADNSFGPSSYIVGPSVGAGCFFTTVQAAIDQAVADGKLPELPDDDASEQEVSLWVGKATLARLQHLVNEYARNNAEEA